jgi:hypothetical protein
VRGAALSLETMDGRVCPHCGATIYLDECECDGSEMSADEFERLLKRAWLAEQRKKVKEALERALGGRGLTNRNVRHGL